MLILDFLMFSRCQFPTGQKSGLEGAINIALSSDKILSTSLTTLQAVVSVMTRYRLIQKEISSCTDKVPYLFVDSVHRCTILYN